MADEGLFQIYRDLLGKEDKPNVVLVNFIYALFYRKAEAKDYALVGKLIKLYGKWVVFNAIIEMYHMDDPNLRNYYPLLNYFCNKVVNKSDNISFELSNRVEEINKKIIELKKDQ